MTGAGPRRILFVHGQAERYGSDIALLALVRELSARGAEVTIALGQNGPLAADLREAGAAVVVSPVAAFRRVYRGRQWLRYFLFEVPRAIVATRRLARGKDVVHLNAAILFGAGLGAAVSRTPVVWHLRESFSADWNLWRIYGRLIGACSEVVVANSAMIEAEAVAVGLVGKTVLLPDAVEFGDVDTPDADAVGIVAIGRINGTKGHHVLVDAARALKDRGVEVTVSIAGDPFPGQEVRLEELRGQIDRQDLSGAVALLGYVDDVPSLLRRNRIFVLPSLRPESFGIALVEAMAAGLACVATSHGGPVDIIDDGRTGILVEPGDAASLAHAIERLITDPRYASEMGRAGSACVRQRYAAAVIVDELLCIYDRAIDAT